MIEIKGKYTSAKIMIDQFDKLCMSQIVEMINHEAFTNQVSIMPDCHPGEGSVIGFTMPIGDKIIPNVIGVDINCGMLSYCVGFLDISDYLELDRKIRDEIPFGPNINKKSKTRVNKEFAEICKRVGIDFEYAIKSLGSLGSGNHFIEFGKSEISGIWITVHSGSRNFGKKVCEYWQDKASIRNFEKQYGDPINVIKAIKELHPKKEWHHRITKYKLELKKHTKSKLDYLDGNNKDNYIEDMKEAQNYAQTNRHIIMQNIIDILGKPKIIDMIETSHNFIDMQDHIIRKGAIRSYVGERMIIPFNMKVGLLICEGKSNPDWNFSAPHGAGRLLSRSQAKSLLKLEKFKDDMKGIFSTSIGMGTIDEAPDAYKDPKIIEEAIEPTAKILDRVIPILNMKDVSEKRSWEK